VKLESPQQRAVEGGLLHRRRLELVQIHAVDAHVDVAGRIVAPRIDLHPAGQLPLFQCERERIDGEHAAIEHDAQPE
jgi:hypothetical protein